MNDRLRAAIINLAKDPGQLGAAIADLEEGAQLQSDDAEQPEYGEVLAALAAILQEFV